MVRGAGRSVIVGADRGGVSKTLMSAAIVDSILARKGEVRVVEYEVEPRIQSILKVLSGLPPVENRPVAAEAGSVMAAGLDDEKADAAIGVWDQMLDELGEGNRVYDTAANVLSQMLDGLHLSGVKGIVGEGENLGFVLPATAERYAYAAVPSLAQKIRRIFPASPIWLVENLRDGQFPEPTGSYAELRSSARVVSVPSLDTRWTAQLTGYPVSRLLRMDGPLLQQLFDLKYGPAARLNVFVQTFAKGLAEAADPIAAWYQGQEEVAESQGAATFPAKA